MIYVLSLGPAVVLDLEGVINSDQGLIRTETRVVFANDSSNLGRGWLNLLGIKIERKNFY